MLETKSVTRKTKEVFCGIRPATSVTGGKLRVGRQQCGGFGSGQTSHGVHELAFFRDPPGLE